VALFIFAVLVVLPFTVPGENAFYIGFLSVSHSGILLATRVSLKAFSVMLLIFPMLSTMKFVVFIKTLEHFKIPDKLVQMISFIYRYIFVVSNEFQRTLRSVSSRNVGKKTRIFHHHILSNIIGMTLVRSYERGERIRIAMLSRGYNGNMKTLNSFRMTKKDLIKCSIIIIWSISLHVIVLTKDDRDIIVKNLSYVYPDGTPALKDVCFEITKGENVALVGQNGAGKSTLLLHLNGVIENNNGRITIAGKQLDKKNVPDIRKKVGVVFQDPDDQLFMSTVFDDVAFGPINMGFSEETVKERVKKSLQKVGLSGFEERCPHHLSFGEKKRISVATVLSMTPAILLLDEPTSNLDPGGRRNIIETLKTLDSTKIIASHDIESLLEICDKAILMDKGKY
jgi:cobalt/nickel transport system ATP-binding protein